MSALFARNIHLRFGNTKVLDGLNLQVETGEIVCIWGPSGEGKTSFLRVLGGLEKAEAGDIRFFDERVQMDYPSALDPARKRVGFIFQNCALISNMSVYDNVALPLRYHQISPPGGLDAHIDMVLRNMLVEDYKKQYPHQLSLGLQKRVAVARALALDPDFLLMDEPTSGLDHLSRLNLLALISNMSQLRRTTAVFVTHDLLIPLELKAKVSVLWNGKLSEPMHFDKLHELPIEFVQDILSELRSQERYQKLHQYFVENLRHRGVDEKLLRKSQEFAFAQFESEENRISEDQFPFP